MAKLQLSGFEELEMKLSKLADPEISKEVVMAGAQPVADEIRKSLESLPEDKFRRLKKGEVFVGVPKQQKQDLLDSLGIAPPDIDYQGNTNTKVGFDGYGSIPTKKYPKGIPNPLLARAIESGSSVRKKTPFMRKAANKARKTAEEEMQKKYDEKVENIMKG
ncbi:hypothetical protein DFR55_101356 [Herbinix hemicellulosilytica]|uniref:HK97 gp10 family phage protein n=1 Tax=Herbinix hemicellulosilytica TaxID=1564487 RepID=A0A0H5SHP6_HERHM|nr:hypothetical protein [Herbinix hemicellulosilytica]RBP60895.1 hypothetical protein DFR55_101356 [Herbinix hemicellulosilytica]CRZ34590.1 hypothetical protein HHT355_1389 [Herbinix hemicellulosilytica]